jgi:hypothetical protein
VKIPNVAIAAVALFVATATTVTASAWSSVTLPSRSLFMTVRAKDAEA